MARAALIIGPANQTIAVNFGNTRVFFQSARSAASAYSRAHRFAYPGQIAM